jgi:hypothetical protein
LVNWCWERYIDGWCVVQGVVELLAQSLAAERSVSGAFAVVSVAHSFFSFGLVKCMRTVELIASRRRQPADGRNKIYGNREG